jgi:hypothetical protein
MVLKCDIGSEGSGGSGERGGLGYGLSKGLGLAMELVLGLLVGLRRALALLHSPKPGLDPPGELLTAQAPNPFNQLFHPAIGPDPETDGVLLHPWPGQVC